MERWARNGGVFVACCGVSLGGLKSVDGVPVHRDRDAFEPGVQVGIGLPGPREREGVFVHPSMVRAEVVFTSSEQAFAFLKGWRHAGAHVVLIRLGGGWACWRNAVSGGGHNPRVVP